MELLKGVFRAQCELEGILHANLSNSRVYNMHLKWTCECNPPVAYPKLTCFQLSTKPKVGLSLHVF